MTPPLLPAAAGERRHRIGLEGPGTAVPDLDGGYTAPWIPLTPSWTYASIQPATARDLERVAGSTVIASASHVVRIPYHAGVTIASRVTFGTRVFSVVGLANPEERNRELILTCEEILDE